MAKERTNVRAAAARIIDQVLHQGRSLTPLLLHGPVDLIGADRSLLRALCFGTLRTLPQLEWHLRQLVTVPLVRKQPQVHCLLLVGCYQLFHTRIPFYAAINETVKGVSALQRPHLKGLVNAVMRRFLQQKETLDHPLDRPQAYRSLHPDWLLARLQQAYPQQWQQIIEANNQHPPLWLRVNRQRCTREDYLALVQAAGLEASVHPTLADAIHLLTAVEITRLPGFSEGLVTVQDSAAQQCVVLLEPQAGEQILDLCAAPGGKTTHILEHVPQASVVAVDHDPERLQRLRENLQRLQLQAEIICGDARQPQRWCHGRLFDRILLDAPCSASGVIRRHPDIKWLRRPSDMVQLISQQQALLRAAWTLLRPGGMLLYVTCSVLPEENQEQIQTLLSTEKNARVVSTGDRSQPGWQCLPQTGGGDGFFYAKLVKQPQVPPV